MKREASSGVMISWVRHGRSSDIAQLLGLPILDPPPTERRASTPVRYLRRSAQSIRWIQQHRPRVIIVMAPPFVAALVAVLVAKAFGGVVVLDAHSGTFNDPRWSWSHPAVRWIVRRAKLTIVTNAGMADVVKEMGGTAFVLDDPVDVATPSADWVASTVLMPCTYAEDEPVEAVAEAASLVPDVRIRLTGRVPDRYASLLADHPPNLEFLGWLSDDDYTAAMRGANVVLALTTRHETMQRGGYEALVVGRPLVTSNTDVLRSYFGEAAIYAEPTGPSIAAALTAAIDNSQQLGFEMESLAKRKAQETVERTADLRRKLDLR